MEINKYHNKRLLVVGGTGFIGQHVVKKALQIGFNVTVLSKNNPRNLQIDKVKFINTDIGHKENLKDSLGNKVFDYVINLGGYIDHAHYSSGGKEVFDAHFNGVRNLVDCIDKQKIKGFIQIGSSDEYGNNLAPQSENQKESPNSPYSCAKVSSTYFLQMLYRTENFPVVILRPFNVYGPGQNDQRFIPQIIKGCLNDQMFPTSKGNQLRDFCFIDDFVLAVFSAINNKHAYGEIINIGSGNPISVKHVIKMVKDIVGSGQPQFGSVPYRKGENMELYAEISKSKRILQWTPKVTLDKGIKITIKYFRNEVM